MYHTAGGRPGVASRVHFAEQRVAGEASDQQHHGKHGGHRKGEEGANAGNAAEIHFIVEGHVP